MMLHFFPQRLGQIGHGVPVHNAADVKPVEQLRDAIRGLVPRGELCFEFFARQRFDVRQH